MRRSSATIEKLLVSRVQQILHVIQQLTDNRVPLERTNIFGIFNAAMNKCIGLALKETNGNVAAAARLLGMNRTTIVERRRRKHRLIGSVRRIRRHDILADPRDAGSEEE